MLNALLFIVLFKFLMPLIVYCSFIYGIILFITTHPSMEKSITLNSNLIEWLQVGFEFWLFDCFTCLKIFIFWYRLWQLRFILQITFVVQEVRLRIPFYIQSYRKTIYKAYVPSTIYIDSIQFAQKSLKKIKSFEQWINGRKLYHFSFLSKFSL